MEPAAVFLLPALPVQGQPVYSLHGAQGHRRREGLCWSESAGPTQWSERPKLAGVDGFIPVLQLLAGPRNLRWVGTSHQSGSEPKGAALPPSQPPPSNSAVQAPSQQGTWEVAPVTVSVLIALLGTLGRPKDVRGESLFSQAAWAVPESSSRGAASFPSRWAAGCSQGAQFGPSSAPR